MSVQVSPVRSFHRHVLLSVPAASLAGPSALHQLIIHLQFSGSSSAIHCPVSCYSHKNDTIFRIIHVASFVFDPPYSPGPLFALLLCVCLQTKLSEICQTKNSPPPSSWNTHLPARCLLTIPDHGERTPMVQQSPINLHVEETSCRSRFLKGRPPSGTNWRLKEAQKRKEHRATVGQKSI